jgi:anti-sigma factor RsiW
VIEAQEHLAGCVACQRFAREMRALGDVVREAAPREQAPAEVRGRLFAAVARARAGLQPTPRRRARAPWLAAAVLLVALAGALTANHLRRDGHVDLISAIAEDHARALGDTHIASADAAEVTRWLERRVHFAMHVPALPGARLLGARLCVMDGRRGAVVEYGVNGVAVSYFVVPFAVPEEGAPPADAGPARFDRATRAGYAVVSWREPGLLHAMVGNLPESQLTTLARACVEQARRAMAWLGLRLRTQEG